MAHSDKTMDTGTKRKTWLWVIGWLCVFPVPLTILLLRNKSLSQNKRYAIIAVAWIVYLIIAFVGRGSGRNTLNTEKRTITAIDYGYIESTIDTTVGDEPISGYVRVNINDRNSFSSDDIVFVSDNPEIATIRYTEQKATIYLYYEITPVSEGETYIYARSSDGTVSTDKVRVVVHGIIEPDSVTIDETNVNLILGETNRLTAIVQPSDAADKTVSWDSSDTSIVAIDSAGNITGISDGSAVITVTTFNGVSDECSVFVDGTKRMVSLSITRTRMDDNYIGDEWSYTQQINGYDVSNGDYSISVGDELVFYLRYSEDDDNPDVGEASVKHTVTEEDFLSGFSVDVDIYISENGGRNSGDTVHYITSFLFSVD